MKKELKTTIDDLPNEVWRDVAGYEGMYVVSNLGRVKSLSRKVMWRGRAKDIIGRILKPSFINGYRQVLLCSIKQRSFRVHRLVAITFIPNPHNFPEINHIDGIKDNNKVDNLEWCTPHYNMVYSYRKLGRIPIHGETHNKAKLTNEDVREIRRKYIPYKYSFRKLGIEFGVDQSAISLIINGKNWKYLK